MFSFLNVTQLQDVIYRIKTAFNTEFEAMHRQKVQELNRVRDRNRHIRDIMQELDMNEKLWEPSLSNSEWPERMLTVDDSEVTTIKQYSSLKVQQTKCCVKLLCGCCCFLLECKIVCVYHHMIIFFSQFTRDLCTFVPF